MPLLSKSSLKPDFIDEPSVFDPLYKRVIRGAVKGLGLDDAQGGLPTPTAMGSMVATETAKKVAPKKAVVELVDLLMGRSKRLPGFEPVKVLTDKEASLAGMSSLRTHAIPPPSTAIAVHPYSQEFKGMHRTLPRAEGISEAYRARQRFNGLDPYKQEKRYVGSFAKAEHTPVKEPPRNPYITEGRDMTVGTNTQPLVEEMGSLHNAGKAAGVQKVYTNKEITGMMEGPKKAFRAGLITRDELDNILAQNQAKIDAQQTGLRVLDQQLYKDKMRQAIAKKQTPENAASMKRIQALLDGGK